LVTLAAAAAGVAAAGWHDVWPLIGAGSGGAVTKAHVRTPPPDPGYAQGRPLQALRSPVHSLHDLQPAAPPNAVALTIDDGPHPVWTPMMLDVLAGFGVTATFSMIGVQVTEYPHLVQRIVAAGHQVADHTVTHPMNLPRLAPDRMRQEIIGGHDRIAQVTGVGPKFFRSPGGAWSPQVLATATEHGMISIDWQVDPRDWARPGSGTISQILLRAQPGDILLCHDGGGDRGQTVEAVRTIVPALKQRGLTFVAL
jgi:peptidoglycan/xylan/chitin deacetylase (PgdA/CDA1 family)